MTTATKKMYAWNWTSGGYNDCMATSKREAIRIGNAMTTGCVKLTVNENTVRIIKDVAAYHKSLPYWD